MTTRFREDCIDLLMRLHGLAVYTDNDAAKNDGRDPQLAQALRDHSAQTRRLMGYIEERCELECVPDAHPPVWQNKG